MSTDPKNKPATKKEEQLRKEEHTKAGGSENENEKFSPSEPDGYNAEDFATD